VRFDGGSIAEFLAQNRAIVQDPAATLVAEFAAAPAGVICDVCAAPGGKALVMAAAVGARGMVLASDVAPARLRRALENQQRTDMNNIQFAVADARHPAFRAADVVFVDAPCTGTGTFRRHPDGKWRLRPDDLRALTRLQAEILDAVSDRVKVGGFLVYATCSIEPEENAEQVNAFLDRHPNFLRRPPADWPRPDLVDEIGDLVVLPQQSGSDGAYAARLERVS
jgi:16S rRNA (cytosine967-C5)-methyltransferase